MVVISEADLSQARILTTKERFQLQGWPASECDIPEEATVTDEKRLMGNMMYVLVVGALWVAVLTAVPLRSP